MSWFLVVHIGAGFHHPSKDEDYRILLSAAIQHGQRLLSRGVSAEEVLSSTLALIEDSPLTNAGYGSNLNIHGQVESDASIMVAQPQRDRPATTQTGAVGALVGIKNPIRVATQLLLDKKQSVYAPSGLVYPTFLSGIGASEYARERGLPMAELAASFQKKQWQHLVRQFAPALPLGSPSSSSCQLPPPPPPSKKRPLSEISQSLRLDTVGAICIDIHGAIGSAVSSGGILLKPLGRMGSAACLGSGCWVECRRPETTTTTTMDSSPSTASMNQLGRFAAVTTSGLGEIIIERLLASSVSSMLCQDPSETVDARLMTFLRETAPHPVAFLSLSGRNFDNNELISDVQLHCGFTTESFAYAYATNNFETIPIHISRKDQNSTFQLHFAPLI